MSSKSSLISKVGDYLQDREKNTNFGTCKRCFKRVYWSTTKIASHIRSGHCPGASEEEVERFKREFVYDSPKNLVHKSEVKNKSEESLKRKLIKSPEKDSVVKKQKEAAYVVQEHYIDDDNDEHIVYAVEGAADPTETEDNLEIYAEESYQQLPPPAPTEVLPAEITKENKFIAAVYPQFKDKTRLQLIDDILDMKRQLELLQAKVKTYENTIHKLL